MRWADAHAVVEELRADTRLWLPALTTRRGFASSRVEHLLNRLVARMPQTEAYLEVGTLEGRTLDAAAYGNDGKLLVGCDPCIKYDEKPAPFPPNVRFQQVGWQALLAQPFPMPLGCVFYDGDHSAAETAAFMRAVTPHLAPEAVLVLDDWDRVTVREGAFAAGPEWRLLRECPQYGDGLTCPSAHFGYAFGISLWGYGRG